MTIISMPKIDLKNCLNAVCPWSGDPVREDSLTVYRGNIVGFCNPGCRDKFEKATLAFELAIDAWWMRQMRAGWIVPHAKGRHQ
jgi:hypothetical protein